MVLWFKAATEAGEQNVTTVALNVTKVQMILVTAGLKICFCIG